MKKSKVDSVFLAGILKSRDLKSFGNDKCFQSLIKELKSLEIDGIEINSNDGDGPKIKVHFILGLVLGDNLGLNTVLDFNKSFSSNSFCRFCKVKKLETKSLTIERDDMLRNRSNYEKDVLLNNPSETGIQNYSQLNEIPSFHVVENFCVDLMHDIFEGVCHYDICHVIEYFINKASYFSLETLNTRKQTFQYGAIEIDNMSGEIKIAQIKTKHLKMTAREMMTFISFFHLMIEDLVPHDDEVWKFLLSFIEIIDLLLAFEICDEIIPMLRKKIEIHNRDYVRLFNDTLKPKHHILTHYPTVIKQSGPVRSFWCFKFEAKHKEFKLYSHAIMSRKNICLTLAKKYQLKTAFKLLNNIDNISTCYYEVYDKHKIVSDFKNLISEMLRVPKTQVEFYSKAEIEGYKYQQKFYIARFITDIELYIIVDIGLLRKNKVFLFCQKLNRIQYNPSILSFEVDEKQLGSFSIIFPKDIVGPPMNLIKTATGKSILRVKEYYFSK
ncbi:uncharacterized protein LOC129940004 [Eupeodes corollae]|uniref:uncharacterized protein LOC129940004 n=1 Tax=Eupeodes corollae TaxID=290404 RepID=UPI002490F88D|nr:uncharacterized protein LOC129940004 [Eupeodes corollae]